MPPSIEITTVRLRLRPWRAVDRVPFAAINADPAVMAFFPSTLTRDASDRTVDRWQAHLDGHGWGMWATEFADKLGLQPHGAPFRHPSLPADSPLCECCMYSITREQWQLRG